MIVSQSTAVPASPVAITATGLTLPAPLAQHLQNQAKHLLQSNAGIVTEVSLNFELPENGRLSAKGSVQLAAGPAVLASVSGLDLEELAGHLLSRLDTLLRRSLRAAKPTTTAAHSWK